MKTTTCSLSRINVLAFTLLACGAGHAEQIKYSSGAVLQVDLGCKKKNGKKDQLIWTASNVKQVKSGRISLQYLSSVDGNDLMFRNGVGGQSVYTKRFHAADPSLLTISGQGTFDAATVSGTGDITLASSRVTVKLGSGSLGTVDATKGTLSLNKTKLAELIVGEKATGTDVSATKLTVATGGRLVATRITADNLIVNGDMLANGGFKTATIGTEGKLLLLSSAVTDLTVSGSLQLRALRTLSVGKLTVSSGRLFLTYEGDLTAGQVITLINNVGTTASPAFSGVPEGQIIPIFDKSNVTVSKRVKISYLGGTGNDVTATVQADAEEEE